MNVCGDGGVGKDGVCGLVGGWMDGLVGGWVGGLVNIWVGWFGWVCGWVAGLGWVGLGGMVGRERWVDGQVGEWVDGRVSGASRALCADPACRVAHDRGLREANSCHTFTMVSTRVG